MMPREAVAWKAKVEERLPRRCAAGDCRGHLSLQIPASNTGLVIQKKKDCWEFHQLPRAGPPVLLSISRLAHSSSRSSEPAALMDRKWLSVSSLSSVIASLIPSHHTMPWEMLKFPLASLLVPWDRGCPVPPSSECWACQALLPDWR